MNIQLRDSRPLQEGMLKVVSEALNRKVTTLAKAQLHPELIEGRVVTTGGGFEVFSENAIDRRNLNWFMPGPGVCTATWQLCGKDESRIPSSLVFAFDHGGKLVLRTQDNADIGRLTSTVPADQSVRFDAVYDGERITLTRHFTESPRPVSSRSDADLQVDAARLGVPWDKRCSRETMIQRIEAARKLEAETSPA